MSDDELLGIIRDIWERRASVTEVGDCYEVVLDWDLIDRIRQALGIIVDWPPAGGHHEALYTPEETARINELEMWGPEGRPRGPWL